MLVRTNICKYLTILLSSYLKIFKFMLLRPDLIFYDTFRSLKISDVKKGQDKMEKEKRSTLYGEAMNVSYL